ncbi:17007_t:CDS:2 [Racocetra fulgida]|uniref:17007_t:CDS:1 n=1 Tax=Racocetra fulgida TaxID=60492 RepID=A0A9N9CVA7_9GLOM|nr:17007_t:CDS:2 [Racocetra fulgida]
MVSDKPIRIGLLARNRNQKSTDRKSLKGASEGGYISEFLTYVLRPLLHEIVKYNIKIVTNAGGLDPLACKSAIESLVKDLDLDGKVIVAAVTGDDILDKVHNDNELLKFSHIQGNSEDTEWFPLGDKKVISLNTYLGAIPIVKALNSGANIVVTGRCVDSALVLGPLIHEFSWDPYNDWDLLASGSLAGHIIECGCQATGGNFTDWRQSAFSPDGGWNNMGYPIVEYFKDGEFFVTKPKYTGGLVTPATVGEQMVYEILDPGTYILPDVILDLRGVKLKQVGENKVLVTGAKGRAPTKYLKVSGIYSDGYKMTGQLVIGGIDAWNVNVEVLGAEHTYGGLGRPHPSPCLVHFARLISKDSVSSFVVVGNESSEKVTFDGPTHNDNIIPPPLPKIPNEMDGKIDSGMMIKVPLIKLAWGRSGDKGDVCNIGE